MPTSLGRLSSTASPYVSGHILKMAAALLLPLTMLTLGGCDKQKPQSPQASSADAAVPNSSFPTYRVDRSHAGQALPEAELTDASGNMVRIASLDGKPIVLNLWATWCAPCVAELPTLDNLAREGGSQFTVVALSQDLGDYNVPTAFLRQRNLTHLVGWHDGGNILGIAMGQALPTTILVGADGREKLRVIGPLDWNGAEASFLLREAGISPVT